MKTSKFRPLTKYTSGKQVRALRHAIKASGWESFSATKFAAYLDISPSYLQAIETDERPITAELAVKIKNVEAEFLYKVKAQERAKQDTLRLLVDTVLCHAQELPLRDRNRLRRKLK